jgi:TolB protein
MSLVEQQSRNDGASQIHIKSIDGSHDIALTHDTWANISPIWSHDGTKIAFLSERDGIYNVFALYVMAKDGSNLKRLTDPIFSERTTLS